MPAYPWVSPRAKPISSIGARDRAAELLSGVTVEIAHVRLCHSRMLFARAYLGETREIVIDACKSRGAMP
jgi:hypothetical protein